MVTGAIRRAAAVPCTSPSVLSAGSWRRAMRIAMVDAAEQAEGLSSVNSVPVKFPFRSIGTPATMLANATPQSTAGSHDPNAIARSQRARHRSSSILPRYSKATPRAMSAMSTSSNGR
jgi:hypothetical protein